MPNQAELYTDGSCKGNPGRGGWGVLIRIDGKEHELFGGEINTTNNRMELTAVIKGLEAVPESYRVRVTTDSQYVKNGITKWITQWKKRGWKTANNQPVKNQDLWEGLHGLVNRHQQIEWLWVRGHNGHRENERADQLADKGVAQASTVAKTVTKAVTTTVTKTTPKPPAKTPKTGKADNKSKSPNTVNKPNSDKPNARQIILDTETTGLDPEQGHRIIEIGGVELLNRCLTGNNFHHYLQPDRAIDEGAFKVHGISNDFLADKPRFTDIAEDLLAYLQGAELIIHNAPFDVAFLNAELKLLASANGNTPLRIENMCSITDTLAIARKAYPGQRNSLDALCKRYSIDQSKRTLHGALLDAELLAEVYLAMTGGQVSLSLDANAPKSSATELSKPAHKLNTNRPPLLIVRASAEEEAMHQTRMERIDKNSGGQCLWQRMLS